MNNNNKSGGKSFYHFTIELLNKHHIQYLVGGAYAYMEYTGIFRDTKDIDIFCRHGEYEKILMLFSERNYKYEITDARWIAKVFNNEAEDYVDIIFNNPNNICPVDDTWFDHAKVGNLFDLPVLFMAPEEMIWSKIFVQDRERYDGSDINHLILKQTHNLDWQRLNNRMKPHWQLLFSQIIIFQYVYPSERDAVPKWLVEELSQKALDQYKFTPSSDKVCRGPYLDNQQYEVDIKEWGYRAITNKTV
jgi:hypothetical protein